MFKRHHCWKEHTGTLSGSDITHTPDSLWCARADQVKRLNSSVQTGSDMTSHPAPPFCACTAIAIPPTQIRMHVEPHRVWEWMSSLWLVSASVLIMQHLTPKAGVLRLLHLWVSPYQGMQPRQAGRQAGRACRLCNTPLFNSHVRRPAKIADRMSAPCPLAEARPQQNKQLRGVEPDEAPPFWCLKGFSSKARDQELLWSQLVLTSPSPAVLSAVNHSTPSLLLNSVLHFCCKAAKPLCQISAPLRACN